MLQYYQFFVIIVLFFCNSCGCDGCKNPYLDDYKSHYDITQETVPTPEDFTEEPAQVEEQENTTQADEAAKDPIEIKRKKSKPASPENKLVSPITEAMIARAKNAGHTFLANKLRDLKNRKKVDINEKKTTIVNNYNDVGNTALHFAALMGDVEIVQLLFDLGANIEAQEVNGNTPLHWAAQFGHKTVVELLLNEGANIKAQGHYGRTPLQAAVVYSNNQEVIELLRKKEKEVAKGATSS